jgi:hypothetical protein
MRERSSIVLYKYYPPERVDNLERRRIYFSHASRFNDPFETSPYFSPSLETRMIEAIGPPYGSIAVSRERIIAAVAGPLRHSPCLTTVRTFFSGLTTQRGIKDSPSDSWRVTRSYGDDSTASQET